MISQDNPLRVLFINPFGIGDCLFTTTLVRAVKGNLPESYIGYWCNERVGPLLKANPDIKRVFALSRGDIKKIFKASFFQGLSKSLHLYFELKKERFDISLDFSLDHRYSLITKMLGIKKRIGFDYKNRGRFLTHSLSLEGYNSRHVVDYYLELLRFLNIQPKDKKLYLSISSENKEKIKKKFATLGINQGDLVIGIAPGAGASWGKDAIFKQWMPIRFAQVADRLIVEYNAKIIILADASERAISDIIVSSMKNRPIDLTGRTSIEELAAVISNLDMLITNDGGPMHMAVALGVRCVAIFGPVDEAVYGPYPASPRYTVVKHTLDCRPCYKNFKFALCDRESECLKSISVDEVFNSVKKGLADDTHIGS